MAFGTRGGFEALRIVAFGSITGSYAALGPATAGHSRLVTFVNSTDKDILISLDGVNDNIRLFTGSFQLFDFTTNRVRDDGFFLPQGTTFFVKHTGSAPTSGNVWIEVISATAGGT